MPAQRHSQLTPIVLGQGCMCVQATTTTITTATTAAADNDSSD